MRRPHRPTPVPVVRIQRVERRGWGGEQRKAGRRRLGDTSLPAKAKASAHVRRYGRGGSRRNGGLGRFRERSITLTPHRPTPLTLVRIWRVARRGWGGEDRVYVVV